MQLGEIHTTVHLSIDDAKMLDESAKKLGKTRSQLMMLLMLRIVAHWRELRRKFFSVKYQRACRGGSWKVKHVFLSGKEYELCIDMRKFFKWSVSALLAFAIHMYLDEIRAGGKEKARYEADNYFLAAYDFTGKLDKNTICWHTIWFLSEQLAQKLAH
jgi:hypothetical protein